MRKIDTPKFSSEAEEAQWWFDNRSVISQAFEDEHPLSPGKIPVDLLLDEQDATLADIQASFEGMSREAYMAQVLHRALNERKAA